MKEVRVQKQILVHAPFPLRFACVFRFLTLPLFAAPLCLSVQLCKDPWDADYIDKIGEDRQALYDLILVSGQRRRLSKRQVLWT
jgi:hypothetical protein